MKNSQLRRVVNTDITHQRAELRCGVETLTSGDSEWKPWLMSEWGSVIELFPHLKNDEFRIFNIRNLRFTLYLGSSRRIISLFELV